MNNSKWMIIPGSGGNFLDPPGWPTHTSHVEERSMGRMLSFVSLTYAASDETPYIEAGVKAEARRKLAEAKTNLLPFDDPKIIEWCAMIENYFHNCYSPDGINRSASDCLVLKKGIRERSLAVLFIREYYPSYRRLPRKVRDAMPTAAWGKGK